jgi:hypothetical protein
VTLQSAFAGLPRKCAPASLARAGGFRFAHRLDTPGLKVGSTFGADSGFLCRAQRTRP